MAFVLSKTQIYTFHFLGELTISLSFRDFPILESFRETVNYSRVFFCGQLQRECSNFPVKMVAFARTKGEPVLHWEGSSFQLWKNRTTRFLRKSVWTGA